MRTLRQLPLVLGLLAVLALLLAGIVVLSYQMAYAERIYPGVEVGGVDLGGLDLAQAEERLAQELRWAPKATLDLGYGEKVESFSPQRVGVRVDARATAEAAFRVGREGGIPRELGVQWWALRGGWGLEPEIFLDEAQAKEFLARLASQIDLPPQPAKLEMAESEPRLSPSQKGRVLDQEAALEAIRGEVMKPRGKELVLPVKEVEAPLGTANLQEGTSHVAQGDLILVYAETIWLWEGGMPVSKTTVHRWLLDGVRLREMLTLREVASGDGKKLSLALDEAKLAGFLRPIAARIDQPARDARFNFDPKTGELTPFITSQEKRTLDITATVKLISDHLSGPERTLTLPVLVEKPRIPMEEVASFGIVELVAKGTSTFKGSSPERIRNIQAATSRFHGVVVRPGEVFSFNRFLGEVGGAFGYQRAYVIFGDRTELGAGGGTCQVSTTAFRAAFFGGFPIVERWPHAYRVGYYEPPLGLDATVFAPDVDLKFLNDGPAHLLVQTEVDIRATTLTFYFYGTKLPRTVEMSGPQVANEIPHPEPIYEEDPSLPPGTKKQVEWAHDGADVTIYRIVREGDKVISKDKFFSRYKPWAERYLVGPENKEEKKAEG